ncbi:MAG TPA: hypothetical protein VLA61_18190 [Ideonella sp.]|uniref:hypothetical protein n=1 Tax=Ideonella sp. TaxID=1929293 RepID=UPI002CECC4D9|nr:hypothetical protein [Ideonella sp.]HSI50207.1 hypothetical protein [Ideonella sp.]
MIVASATNGSCKIDRNKRDAKDICQGVVAWDVEVRNQHGEMVASHDILTLVAKKARPAFPPTQSRCQRRGTVAHGTSRPLARGAGFDACR